MANVGFSIALAASGLLAACSPFGGASVFNCERDDQCTPGRCLSVEGLCVVPDDNCGAGGEAYGPNSGGKSGECVGGEPMIDALPIDAPTMCTPNVTYCFQGAVETCLANGMGYDPGLRDPCAIQCDDTGPMPACVGAASNIPLADQKACHATGQAIALMPTTGTVTINATNITCSATCNGTENMIPRTSTTPNNFFCLASINLPAAVTVTVGAGITSGITLFSAGPVAINTDVAFDGGNATGVLNTQNNDDLPGGGGPGGGTGGAPSINNGAGNDGTGVATCTGKAGAIVGTGASAAGGGGGGGGNVATGGDGGDARNTLNATADGGAGGTITNCSTADGRPLAGGAGGGGGADGGCGQNVICGWPGGGGGGALHIVSRTMISGTGTLSASGGNGFGLNTEPGGGGGGGAGGMILLEAPTLAFTGTLRVNGGTGGASNSGNGGAGATGGTTSGTDGASSGATTDRGGGGGGGAGGRIRVNGGSASCASASPTGSCTTGALRAAP